MKRRDPLRNLLDQAAGGDESPTRNRFRRRWTASGLFHGERYSRFTVYDNGIEEHGWTVEVLLHIGLKGTLDIKSEEFCWHWWVCGPLVVAVAIEFRQVDDDEDDDD